MLETRNISKFFPSVKALNNVSCRFCEGEIHALLGENGAGKSTLIKIICGMLKQDEGSVYIDGREVHFTSYEDALAAGISVVNQEIQLIPQATIAECMMLDKLKKYRSKAGIDWKRINSDAQTQLEALGLPFSAKTIAGTLNAGQKQLVQIARALCSDPKFLILDEPTSSLSLVETQRLIAILRKLKREKNLCILFISHKLDEVMEICDRVTILRDGTLVCEEDCAKLTKEQIVEMMINRKTNEVNLGSLDIDYSVPALELRNLCQDGRFRDINLKVYKGEILGLYGLVGSGRTELMKAVLGVDRVTGGEILINGKKARIRNISDAVYKYHMGYVSENRKEDGLILKYDLQENTTITIWNRIRSFFKYGPISSRQKREVSQDIIRRLNIKATGVDQIVGTLSGGNQQKVCIAKWLVCDSDILIIDEPTVGVDVGAKEMLHNLIWKIAKEEGKAVILITSEMPEMIKLARRILVFRENRIVAELDYLNDPAQYSYERISADIGKYLV